MKLFVNDQIVSNLFSVSHPLFFQNSAELLLPIEIGQVLNGVDSAN